MKHRSWKDEINEKVNSLFQRKLLQGDDEKMPLDEMKQELGQSHFNLGFKSIIEMLLHLNTVEYSIDTQSAITVDPNSPYFQFGKIGIVSKVEL